MVSRWWKARRDFSFPKIHPLLSPFSSPDNSPSFLFSSFLPHLLPHPPCSTRPPWISLSLSPLHPLSSSFIYVFSSGYKCPRLGVASCFGNEESLPSCCPIPWACLGEASVWRVMGSVGFFSPLSRTGGRKEKGRWLASLFRASRILSSEESGALRG